MGILRKALKRKPKPNGKGKSKSKPTVASKIRSGLTKVERKVGTKPAANAPGRKTDSIVVGKDRVKANQKRQKAIGAIAGGAAAAGGVSFLKGSGSKEKKPNSNDIKSRAMFLRQLEKENPKMTEAAKSKYLAKFEKWVKGKTSKVPFPKK